MKIEITLVGEEDEVERALGVLSDIRAVLIDLRDAVDSLNDTIKAEKEKDHGESNDG